MTNFLISLILGLWLLVAVAFYAAIVGTALYHILAEFRQALGTFARSGNVRLIFPTGRRRLSFLSHPPQMTKTLVLVCILVLSAAVFAWTPSPLIRYCGLFLLVIVPSSWILVQYFNK